MSKVGMEILGGESPCPIWIISGVSGPEHFRNQCGPIEGMERWLYAWQCPTYRAIAGFKTGVRVTEMTLMSSS
jgi:hypothetical protein